MSTGGASPPAPSPVAFADLLAPLVRRAGDEISAAQAGHPRIAPSAWAPALAAFSRRRAPPV